MEGGIEGGRERRKEGGEREDGLRVGEQGVTTQRTCMTTHL